MVFATSFTSSFQSVFFFGLFVFVWISVKAESLLLSMSWKKLDVDTGAVLPKILDFNRTSSDRVRGGGDCSSVNNKGIDSSD